MSKRFLISALAVVFGMFILTATHAAAQSDARDFSGVWTGGPGSDISGDLLPGEEISLTPYAAERYRNLDQAKSPANICLPYGPTRAFQSRDPKHIVQTLGAMAIMFEQTSAYRVIYTDGRGHPPDVWDRPSWDGHSIGRWEGNTLVVDTVGLIDRTWIDSGGFEHSTMLHLVERFQKIDPDTLTWMVTVEDPVFYTKPFTYLRGLRRADPSEIPRILPQICHENEMDFEHLLPTVPNRHVVLPTFPGSVGRR